MNELDQIFQNETNQVQEILKMAQMDPVEMMHKASEMQYAALQEYRHQVMVARIESFIAAIVVIVIARYIWLWFQNTQIHLKQISDAAQSLAKNEKHQNEPIGERMRQNNQEPMLRYPQSSSLKSPPPLSKEQSAQTDFLTSHPDSRYMPKG